MVDFAPLFFRHGGSFFVLILAFPLASLTRVVCVCVSRCVSCRVGVTGFVCRASRRMCRLCVVCRVVSRVCVCRFVGVRVCVTCRASCVSCAFRVTCG